MNEWQIDLIPASETHDLRHRVLRAGKPLSTCKFDGDTDLNTFHLGILQEMTGVSADSEKTILGICSLYARPIPDQTNDINGSFWQLRGMATAPEARQQGLGKRLLEAAEKEVIKRGGTGIWANAREAALNFYHHNGYQDIGGHFDIAEVGLHQRIIKRFV